MPAEHRLSRDLQRSAVVTTLLAAALFFGPWVARLDLFNNDAAHHIFWTYQYADPELFPNDISVDYFQTSAPWGYRALYASIAQFTDVLQAGEWIAVLLFLISALLVWRIAMRTGGSLRELYGLLAIVALAMTLTLSAQRDTLTPLALQRAFSMPLILFTLWALVARSYAWVGVSWLAAALIYPVVLPVQGLTAGILFLREIVLTRRMPAYWLTNGALGAAALALAAFSIPIPAEIGPAYSFEEAMQMPEFGPGGRLFLYPPGTFSWAWGQATGLGWRPEILMLMAAATATAWLLGWRKAIPLPVWVAAFVGVGLWAAMRLFPEQLMFGLYLPNRHARWVVAIFGAFAGGAGAAAVLEYGRNWWARRSPQSAIGGLRWVAVAAPLVMAAVLLPQSLRLWTKPADTDLENVYAFIATLPKATLVAAHPTLADFVPVRSRRSVLTSTEISMAWMHGYYEHMKPRVEASLRAAYATRIEDVDAALAPFRVDVMLSGPSAWQETVYKEPFNELVQSLLARGERDGFALQNPPADRILFNSGEYFVVRVEPCSTDC